MRLIGHFSSDKEARTFGDFLYVQGIETEFEYEDNRYQVWVKSDDDLERATKLMEEFRANPNDPRFQAGSPAEKLRQMQQAEETAYRRRVVSSKSLFPGLANYGFGFITYTLIVGCIVVFFISKMGADRERIMSLYFTLEGGMAEIRRGEVWRLITPIFIHGGGTMRTPTGVDISYAMSFMHILFNMMFLRQLGSLFEARTNSGYFLFFVLVVAAVSNWAEYAIGHHRIFGGMSGVVYGLIGYCWLRGRLDPGAGISLNKQVWIEAIIWFVACFTILRHLIANYAHAGGLFMGLLWAFVDSKRKLRPGD